MKICICDDDFKQVEKLENLINKNPLSKQVVDIDVFYTGSKLLEHIKSENFYNIIFLDIEIGDANGIEIAKKIRKIDSECLIIFVTSYSKYALDSFEVLPFRYIVKPVDEQKFSKVFTEAVEQVESDNNYIILRKSAQRYNIKYSDIVSITSEFGRVINVTLKNEEIISVYGKIKEIERELGVFKFIKINRGTIVNFDYILVFSNSEIKLKNGELFTVSKACQKQVKEMFNTAMSKRVGV